MDDAAQMTRWGSLALVSYIPEPLGSFLNRLRHSLTGEISPHAHVTILPRRPLIIPVETASEQVLERLAGFRSFVIEVSAVRRFQQTNVLYVDISEGSARLHALHDALSMGDLAHNEEFEFRPHLTLGCPESLCDVQALQTVATTAWDSATATRRFLLQDIVCLWLRPDSLPNEWQRLWSHNLQTKQTSRESPAAFAAMSRTY